jgi:hypothetical protein
MHLSFEPCYSSLSFGVMRQFIGTYVPLVGFISAFLLLQSFPALPLSLLENFGGVGTGV